jgi:isoquinoline 1-oxidoreductase beta subunit
VFPAGVIAQMESGILFGLSAALFGQVNVDLGRVVQSNFNDYDVIRLARAPEIHVALVPSSAPPGGAGEPAVPPIAAALTNAIYAASGERIRALPLLRTGFLPS